MKFSVSFLSVSLNKILPAVVLGFAVNAGAADIKISDAMIRAVPSVTTTTTAFMSLENKGEAVQLVSADSSIAERVEIHGHRHVGHKMEMYKMDELPLPANKTVKLESGGYHIMIMGLKRALQVGETVDLTLHFSDSDAIDVKATVMPLEETMSRDPHKQHKSH